MITKLGDKVLLEDLKDIRAGVDKLKTYHPKSGKKLLEHHYHLKDVIHPHIMNSYPETLDDVNKLDKVIKEYKNTHDVVHKKLNDRAIPGRIVHHAVLSPLARFGYMATGIGPKWLVNPYVSGALWGAHKENRKRLVSQEESANKLNRDIIKKKRQLRAFRNEMQAVEG